MTALNKTTKAWLVCAGIALVIGAGSYAYIQQVFGVVSITIAALGVLLLLFCVVYQRRHGLVGVTSIQWRRIGFFTTVATLSIVFLVGVNHFSNRFSYRWDVTQHNQHTLTQATIDFVQGLSERVDEPIELTAFYVGLPPKHLQDLLNEYQRISNGKINAKVIDPIEDIAYAAKFGNLINGQEKKLIVVSGQERRDVDFSEASLTENQITNALARASRELRQVCFLTGHGEFSTTNTDNEGLSLFVELLTSNNILSKNLMLGFEKNVPEDCNVLIVAGPSTDLTDDEKSLLNDYLMRGGDALFLIQDVVITRPGDVLTAEQLSRNPSLNSLLNKWGVNIGDDIVIDLDSHIGGDVGSPATRNYVDHKEITQGLDYTFYLRPRSISEVENRRASVRLAPIALTATKEKSWAETNRNLSIKFDEGIDTLGPVPISYVIWEEKEEGDASDTRVIVFTDADFLSNAYLNQYSNAAMGLNVVNWLSELDYTVFHDQKNIKVERLDLTSKQKRMIAVLLFLMPLLIALAGLFIWIRR